MCTRLWNVQCVFIIVDVAVMLKSYFIMIWKLDFHERQQQWIEWCANIASGLPFELYQTSLV